MGEYTMDRFHIKKVKNHFRFRLWQRYRIKGSQGKLQKDITNIIAQGDHACCLTRDETTKQARYLITYKGIKIPVVYDYQNNIAITALTL